MTTDRETNRLRDKCRKQAIQILALCASNPGCAVNYARYETNAATPAKRFALDAVFYAMRMVHHRGDYFPDVVVFALAEAMIRNGEVVPTW